MSLTLATDTTGRRGHRVWVISDEGPPPDEWATLLSRIGVEVVEVAVRSRTPPPERPERRGVGSPPPAPDDDDDVTEVVFDADTAPPGARVAEWTVDVADDGPILLWHPDGFEAALVRLSQLEPAHLRARTLVCAPGPPPAGFGDTVRQQGGLSWWRAPWKPWLVTLAMEALSRRPGPGLLVPTRALEELQRDARVRPQNFLAAVADAAREALSAAAAEVLVLGATPADTVRLVWSGGRVRSVPLATAPGTLPPAGLAERAVEWRQVVVIPDMAHAVVASGGAWAAAIAVPILTDDGHSGTRAVLQVYWQRPFLPTPTELQVLRTLGTAAAVNQARVVERERLHRAHIESLETLAQVPWSDTRVPADGATTEADLVVRFARRVLQARSGLPGLTGFSARLSTASRSLTPWLRVDPHSSGRVPPERSTDLEALLARCLASSGRPLHTSDGRWALGLELRSPSDSQALGAIVATFDDPFSAEEGTDALRRLAADLQIGLRLLRRSNDNTAMKELARQLADATDPRDTLDQMAGLIQRQLSADGVKVHVLAETRRNARIEQFYRTGQATGRARSVVVDRRRGLADWVVLHDDWICIEHPLDLDGGPLQPTPSRTGHHDTVVVEPRSVTEVWDATDLEDTERVQLLVPLHHRDQVAGVLGVWRTTAHPFESVLDVESLVGFAPHVASACARAKAMERSHDEFTAISQLARDLTPETTLHELGRRILEAAGELSGAHHAVLFRHDTVQPGALAAVDLWSQGPTDRRRRRQYLRRTLAWGADPTLWEDQCRALVEERGPDPEGLQLHQFVVLPPDRSRHALGAVALLTVRDRPSPVPILAEAATRQSTESLLQHGGLLLGNHVRVHAAAVVEQLAQAGGETTDPPLLRAAERLHRTMTDCVVVLTEGTGARQTITAVCPASCTLGVHTADANAFSRSTAPQSHRIGDVAQAAAHIRRLADPHLFEAVQAAREWQGIRSWMAVPVVHGDRLIGTLQVFTPPHGSALLSEHEVLGESLARWAAEETVKSRRRAMLEQLNDITAKLAGVAPSVLATQLPVRLQEWARDALHRSCQVAVVARSGAHHVLVCSGTPAVSDADLTDLRALSLAWTAEDHAWDRRSRLADLPGSDLPGRYAGAAAPLKLASESRLEGHIFLLHSNRFGTPDRDVLADAAREMAVLLHGEAVRHEWKLQAGLFRHALLGPVQGLQSAARYLDVVTQMADPPAGRVQEARDRIAKESETLRMWRETQKIYTMVQEGAPPDVRLRRAPLKPLVSRCMARYEAPMRLRSIDLQLDWRPSGGLQFEFDAAMLDLVLSNLLDNACKYAFYNRSVTVEVGVEGPHVVLTVENVGGPIPDDQAETIYLPGTRARGRDPIRAIAGEGLGLFLSRTLCEAMGGTLSHTCVAEGWVEDDKQPHRVRFTAHLPHRWNRR